MFNRVHPAPSLPDIARQCRLLGSVVSRQHIDICEKEKRMKELQSELENARRALDEKSIECNRLENLSDDLLMKLIIAEQNAGELEKENLALKHAQATLTLKNQHLKDLNFFSTSEIQTLMAINSAQKFLVESTEKTSAISIERLEIKKEWQETEIQTLKSQIGNLSAKLKTFSVIESMPLCTVKFLEDWYLGNKSNERDQLTARCLDTIEQMESTIERLNVQAEYIVNTNHAYVTRIAAQDRMLGVVYEAHAELVQGVRNLVEMIRAELACSITLHPMEHPVIIETGHAYERNELDTYWKRIQRSECPNTRAQCSKNVYPCWSLKNIRAVLDRFEDTVPRYECAEL